VVLCATHDHGRSGLVGTEPIIRLEIDAFCGKLIVIVPAGAQVIDEGGALFAKRAIYGRRDAGDAGWPVIRLTGDARFSKVAVHRGRFDPRDV
jgi:hypothetical protein